MFYFLTPDAYLNGTPTTFNGKPYKDIPYTEATNAQGQLVSRPGGITPEQYVLSGIKIHYKCAMVLADYDPNRKKRGFFAKLFDTTAQAGMYSADGTVARGSIIRVATNEINRQRAWMTTRDRIAQIEREHRQALELAYEYFHGEEDRRRVADAEQARMLLQAEMIAEALARKLSTR